MIDQLPIALSILGCIFLLVSPEMINAIAGLWAWGLLIAVVVVLFIFRTPVGQLVSSVVKLLENIVTRSEDADIAFKAGQVEVAVKASSQIVAVAPEQAPPPADSETPVEAAISSNTTQNLVSQMFDAVRKRSADEIDAIYKKMKETETDPEKRIQHEALYWYSRFEVGDKSAITSLEELAKRESSADPFVWLGFCYEAVSDFRRAGETYESGLQKLTDPKQRGILLTYAATAYTNIGQADKAATLLTRELSVQTDRATLSGLYKALANVYKEANKTHIYIY